MESLEEMQAAAFEIIAFAGEARSNYIEAIREARQDHFDKALQLIKAGEETYRKIHHVHSTLIQREAAGERLPFSILLMHAEDQMLTTETIKVLAVELIEMCKKMNQVTVQAGATVCESK